MGSRYRRRFRDVVLNVLVSVIFVSALGLFIIHATILWNQYQNGYGIWSGVGPFDSIFRMEKAVFSFGSHKSDIYEWSGGQLKVNTSLYVW
jgi:hypothetical protein